MPFLALPRQPTGAAQATKQDEVTAGAAFAVPGRACRNSSGSLHTSAVATAAAYAAPAVSLGTQQQHNPAAQGDSERDNEPVQQLRRSGREQRRQSLLARSQACELLELAGPEDLQDFLASLILCECVYKKVELSQDDLLQTISAMLSAFPPGWVQLDAVEISRSDLQQHYLLATSGDALYVAFMGTKQPRDLVTDAAILHEAVWAESVALAADQQSVPAAHSGFLQRARAINVEQLHELASASGRRLVLCGHSLGGAVAKLSALRLLRDLPEWPAPRIKCMCFATPAIGNAALADLVKNAGWGSHFKTYFLPEDQVMRLMSFSQRSSTNTSAAPTRRSASAPARPPSSSAAASEDAWDGTDASPGPAPTPRRGFSMLGSWRWPSTLASATAASTSALVDEGEVSLVSSMDATEAAIDEILSPSPSIMQHAASDSELPTHSSSSASRGRWPFLPNANAIARSQSLDALDLADLGGEGVGKVSSPPFNLGLAFALQHRRVVRAVTKLATHARIPLPIPRAYYTFGAQVYIHSDRAYCSERLPCRGTAPTAVDAAAAAPGSSSQAPVAATKAPFDAMEGSGTGTVSVSAGTVSTRAPGTAASPSDLSRSVKGPFNFHRMVAHRLRVLSVVASALPQQQRAQHFARVTAAAATIAALSSNAAAAAHSSAASPRSSTGSHSTMQATPSPAPLQPPVSPAAGSGAPAATPRPSRSMLGSRRPPVPTPADLPDASPAALPAKGLQSEGVYPRIAALRAVARLPLEDHFIDDAITTTSASTPSSSVTAAAGSGLRLRTSRSLSSPALGSVASGPAAGGSGRKLSGLWGKKGEEQVPLLLEVEGHNLQYCHHVVVRLATAPTSASQAPGRVALPTEVLQVEAGPVGHRYHPLSGLQSRLHQVAGSVGRYIGRSRTAANSGLAAEQASSRMVLRVMVPRSVVKLLQGQQQQRSSAATSAEPPAHGVQAHGGPAGAGLGSEGAREAPSASPFAQQQPAAALQLELRSHFHEDQAEVRVQPYKAAVLGTSLTAATLLQAALLCSPAAQAQAQADGGGSTRSTHTGAAQSGGKAPAARGAAGRGGVARGRLLDATALATAATAMHGALAWWLPSQPMSWASRLWAAPSIAAGAAADSATSQPITKADTTPSASDPPADLDTGLHQPEVPPAFAASGMSMPTLTPTPFLRSQSNPSGGAAHTALLSMPSGATQPPFADVASASSSLSALTLDTLSCASSARCSSAASISGSSDSIADDDDPATAALLTAWQREASLGASGDLARGKGWVAVGQQEGGELQAGSRLAQLRVRQLVVLQPVAALLLLVRFLGQATARLAAVRMLGRGRGKLDGGAGAAARPAAGAGSRAMHAGAALLMRRRAATYAASVVMLQQLDPNAQAGGGSSSGQNANLTARWFPGMHLLAGFGARSQYLQHMAGMLRPRRWVATAQQGLTVSIGSPLMLSPGIMGQPGSLSLRLRNEEQEDELSPLLAAAQQLEDLTSLAPAPARALSRRGSRELLPRPAAADQPSAAAAPTGGVLPEGDIAGIKAAGRSQGGARAQAQGQRGGSGGTGGVKGLSRVLRLRAQAAAQLGVPALTPCLGGSLLVHNVLASAPSTSPFVVLRALTAALRRQAARIRRQWSMEGLLSQWGRAAAASAGSGVGEPAQRRGGLNALQPAGALLHVYNFLRGIPFWIQQKRSRGALTFEQDYKVLLVAASALDAPRLLQGRDFARLALRASAARTTLLPVLLTSPSVPQQQEQRMRAALGAACGVDAAAVKTVQVEASLLQLQGSWQEDDLAALGTNGLDRARAIGAKVSGVASVRKQLQALLCHEHQHQQQQQLSQQRQVVSSIPAPRSTSSGHLLKKRLNT